MSEKQEPDCVCPFASQVAKKIEQRANVGFKKYGTTCAREDLSISEWLTHLQEELMDASVYIEKAKYDIWRAAEDSKNDAMEASEIEKEVDSLKDIPFCEWRPIPGTDADDGQGPLWFYVYEDPAIVISGCPPDDGEDDEEATEFGTYVCGSEIKALAKFLSNIKVDEKGELIKDV